MCRQGEKLMKTIPKNVEVMYDMTIKEAGKGNLPNLTN